MITVCDGWCNGTVHTERRVLRDDGRDDGRVSHGLCGDCHVAFRAALGPALRAAPFTDQLDPCVGRGEFDDLRAMVETLAAALGYTMRTTP